MITKARERLEKARAMSRVCAMFQPSPALQMEWNTF